MHNKYFFAFSLFCLLLIKIYTLIFEFMHFICTKWYSLYIGYICNYSWSLETSLVNAVCVLFVHTVLLEYPLLLLELLLLLHLFCCCWVIYSSVYLCQKFNLKCWNVEKVLFWLQNETRTWDSHKVIINFLVPPYIALT